MRYTHALFIAVVSETTTPDYNASLLQYGGIGAMLVAILTMSALGIIAFKPTLDWLREQIKQLQGLNAELLESVQKAVPALGEAVSAMRSMADGLRELRGELAAMEREVKSMRDDLNALRNELRDRGR